MKNKIEIETIDANPPRRKVSTKKENKKLISELVSLIKQNNKIIEKFENKNVVFR